MPGLRARVHCSVFLGRRSRFPPLERVWGMVKVKRHHQPAVRREKKRKAQEWETTILLFLLVVFGIVFLFWFGYITYKNYLATAEWAKQGYYDPGGQGGKDFAEY